MLPEGIVNVAAEIIKLTPAWKLRACEGGCLVWKLGKKGDGKTMDITDPANRLDERIHEELDVSGYR